MAEERLAGRGEIFGGVSRLGWRWVLFLNQEADEVGDEAKAIAQADRGIG